MVFLPIILLINLIVVVVALMHIYIAAAIDFAIDDYFEKVSKFVFDAKDKEGKVLLHCIDCLEVAPAMAIAYMYKCIAIKIDIDLDLNNWLKLINIFKHPSSPPLPPPLAG
jgi:hypothetical protein